MNVITPPEQNITLVAFFGNNKSKEIKNMIEQSKNYIRRATRSIGLPKNVFAPYGTEHIHATILGLELVKIGNRAFNANFLNNNGVLRKIQLDLLVEFCRSIAKSREPLFTIRFGGFRKAYCTCASFDLYGWDCPTGGSEFHAFNRSAYEGTFYACSPGPVMLTGWPIESPDHPTNFTRQLYGFRRAAENCGFLDKYHSEEKPYWKDDDFYFRLGRFSKMPGASLDRLVANAREFLSNMQPICVNVFIKDVSFVYYEKPSLKNVVDKISLMEVLGGHRKIESLFSHWGSEH